MSCEKILIFAFARCGSGALLDFTNDLFPENLMHEPFNDDNKILLLHKKENGIKSSLSKIKRKYAGLKHIQGQLTLKENRELLSDPDLSVFFLYRKNSYARTVSLLISQKRKIWDRNLRKASHTPLGSLSIDLIQKGIDSYEKDVVTYRNFLRENTIPHTEITYESLYDPQVTAQEKLQEIKRIFSPIRMLPKDEIILRKINSYFSPKKKHNTSKNYNQISNIREIDKAFGEKYSPLLQNKHQTFLEKIFSFMEYLFGFSSARK